LAEADAKARALEPTLVLGAVSIYIRNACFTRPAEGFGWESLLESCACQTLEDPDDEDSPIVPLLYDSGTYFLCDIVMNAGRYKFLRLPIQRKFEPESVASVYHRKSVDEIKAAFDWSIISQSKKPSNKQRTQNRSRKTRDVDDLRDPDRQPMHLATRIQDVCVKSVVRLAGRDVDLNALHGGEVDEAEDDAQALEIAINQKVAKIYEQFCFDVIEKAPNRKSKQAGSYLSIPLHRRIDLARPELLMAPALPFQQVQYYRCSTEQWEKHFNRIFPMPSSPEAAQNAAGQNFPNCTYYRRYMALASNLQPSSLNKIRGALKVEFDKLAWAPYTCTDRMWGTGAKHTKGWTVLPREAKGGPMIAINPRQRQKVTLLVFDQSGEDATDSEED
jgi:hypothetical protein